MFISSDFDLRKSKIQITDARIFHQIQKVLRMKKGEIIFLGDGHGQEAKAEIKVFGNKELWVQVLESFENTREPGTEITLYISVLKKDKMEWLAEKVTEAGVRNIVPLNSERTVKLNLRYDRLRKIVLEAAEQSGRGIVPDIKEKMDLEEALNEAKNTQDKNLFFDISGDKPSFDSLGGISKKIGIFVGPEGGWSDKELSLARNKDFPIVKMSDLTFRGETAGILATYLSFFVKI